MYMYILIIILFVTMCESSAGITEGFSMCGGDFIEVYSDPNQKGRGNYLKLYFFRIFF
jgi:carnosine N-methyltransferase